MLQRSIRATSTPLRYQWLGSSSLSCSWGLTQSHDVNGAEDERSWGWNKESAAQHLALHRSSNFDQKSIHYFWCAVEPMMSLNLWFGSLDAKASSRRHSDNLKHLGNWWPMRESFENTWINNTEFAEIPGRYIWSELRNCCKSLLVHSWVCQLREAATKWSR